MKTLRGKPKLIQKTINRLCSLLGHKWRYKDYSNWMKENGDKYDFKASRCCSRCNQKEYLYNKWTAANKKSPYDIEIDAQSLKQLHELKMQ